MHDDAITSGTLITIGRLYTVAENQTLMDLVTRLGSSFTQLERHNKRRLEVVMEGKGVFDIDNRHDADGAKLAYDGEEFCVVSTLSKDCLV